MSTNKHIEYKRIVKGADVAVLCVHGIIGTPNHFREFIPLIPESFSVYSMVTDGHCGTVDDFSHSSLKGWEESVERAVAELLETHKEIYVLAHSMGTLLTIEQALKNPCISRLFYLSVPIKVKFRLRMIPMALKIYFKKVKDDDAVVIALRECYGVTDHKNVFKYLGWFPRLFDLFKLIKRVRKKLDLLTTPCVAFQSIPDELVSPRSIDILKNESKMRVVALNHSTHCYYEPKELEYLKEEFIEFLK